MADYILWNGSSEIYSNGSIHLYWYAALIILAFILVPRVIKSLTLKQANPDKLTSKVEYLVLGVVFVALCVARWGDNIFYSKKCESGPIVQNSSGHPQALCGFCGSASTFIAIGYIGHHRRSMVV
ncbi:MAG: prolipoprotein diacylglyceryl transferase [Saprospiraceae bacterium]|nr:prolipoprotein diacylglyceryl transferase [Saprospiraceae bacterium]